MTALPSAYIEQIRELLGEQAEPFLQSYQEARAYGLRLNPLKLGPLSEDERKRVTKQIRQLFGLTPVRWCETGYYYDEATKPGKHPFHHAGLLYIQEPSAMSSAELLRPEPGDVVLDLAAAPGGKTTQLAGMLNGGGLLVANEIHPARAKILSENVERSGIVNAVVTSVAPDALARKFPQRFDKLMLDAPCSGEGMFRKDPEAIGEWSPEHVHMCASRQLDILDAAAILLKPGGTMAYSTCTFNRAENEDVIAAFIAKYPAFRLLNSERLWPHRVRGEGHFVALLQKDAGDAREDAAPPGKAPTRMRGGKAAAPGKAAIEAMRLAEALLREVAPGLALQGGEPVLFGEQLYWLPAVSGSGIGAHELDGLKTLRPGLHLAHLKKGRAEPAHSLALALSADMCASVIRLQADDSALQAYLRGETIAVDPSLSGWTLVTVEGFPLGWGKASGGQLKNHYPKGLRKMG
ncbi:MAG: methyltransferase [Paenibacillus sp.]|nr:methyltransferase [Paenibacillus sp.]